MVDATDALKQAKLDPSAYKAYLEAISAYISQASELNASIISLMDILKRFNKLRTIASGSIEILEQVSQVMGEAMDALESSVDILGLFTTWQDALNASLKELDKIRYKAYQPYFDDIYLPCFNRVTDPAGWRLLPGKFNGFAFRNPTRPVPNWLEVHWGNSPVSHAHLKTLTRKYTSEWIQLTVDERTRLFEHAWYVTNLQNEAGGVTDIPLPGLPEQVSLIVVDHIEDAVGHIAEDGLRFVVAVKDNLLVLTGLTGMKKARKILEATENVKAVIDLAAKLAEH